MTSEGSQQTSVVITRSREGNRELAKKLKMAGLNPVEVDTISFAPPSDWKEIDLLLRCLDGFDWLIFTSASGAKFFESRMKTLSLSMPRAGSLKIAAVGPQTAKSLLRLGVKPDFVPSSYTTRALAEELPALPEARVLLLRADIADRRLALRLMERGFDVEEAAIYRTLPGEATWAGVEDADMIVFASASAVRHFCSLVNKDKLERVRRLRTVCIGPVTESAARENGFVNTSRPESFTIDAVVREVRRLSTGRA